MLINLTASFAQTGSRHVTWHTGEILTCYTTEELRKIANMTAESRKAIDLYQIAQQQLVFKDSIIFAKEHSIIAKDSVIASRELVISLKEEIITGKDNEISELRLANKKYARKNKWLKLKWAGTTVGLTGVLLFSLLK
jgi:hypothetical protein